MKITLRLFAILRERTGVGEITVDLPASATVATARDAFLQQYPDRASLIARVAFAVNHSYAPLDTELHEGDEVAIIPPVSGG
ncbi:MAG TPA: molybdopterin converting factor subunit 1 [Tepidisphaeraceae bacterium]|jgi:molybdopterin converting factor subunit 1|nr:molybdopterin converting factor subunit 1 [Tepidisphaeraceae bacterium]